MSLISCGTLTQNTGTYPGSGTVDGFGVPVDLSICGNIFWTNVDREGVTIQVWNSDKTVRYPVQVVNISKNPREGWLRVWVPQFTNSSTVVLQLWLDTTQTRFTPTITDLSGSLSNNATTNSTANWTADVGSLSSKTTSPTPFSGTGYLAGGANAETRAHPSTDIDISVYATEIDAGTVFFAQVIRQAGFGSGDPDFGETEFECLTSGGATVQARVGSGDLNFTDQTWRWRRQAGYVPPTTRKIRLYYHATRGPSGTNLDAYMNLWQPSLFTVDPYGPEKVFQAWDGSVDIAHAGAQGFWGAADSTGRQNGFINDDPDTFNLIRTITSSGVKRGLAYDYWGSSSLWAGTINNPATPSASIVSGTSIGSLTTLSSTILADSGITSATTVGQPCLYGGNVYVPMNSATQGYICLFNQSTGAFVSKFETTTQTATPRAVTIVPASEPGWTTASLRIFVIAGSTTTQIHEYDSGGSFVQTNSLNFSIATPSGLCYWKNFLWGVSKTGAEVTRINNLFQGTSGMSTAADLAAQGIFGTQPASGDYEGIAVGPGVNGGSALYLTVSSPTASAEEWQPKMMSKCAGGGVYMFGDGRGIKYSGVKEMTVWTLFATGNLENKSSFDRFLVNYWKISSGTANTSRCGIGWHLATSKMGINDSSNGWLDSTLNPSGYNRYVMMYNGTTGRKFYWNGASNVVSSPGAITQKTGLDTIYVGGDDETESDCWVGDGGNTILYPGVASTALIDLDNDSLNSDFWVFDEAELEITSTATIVPTGTVTVTLVEALTSTATIVPTGTVELTAPAGFSSTATVVPTGEVALELVDGLSSVATVVPTGDVVFGVFDAVVNIYSIATIVADSAYTAVIVGANYGPLPYVAYHNEISHEVEVTQPNLEVAVAPIERTVQRSWRIRPY